MATSPLMTTMMPLMALMLMLLPSPSVCEDSITPNYEIDNKYRLFDIKGPLVLSCGVTSEENKSVLKWLKDGTPVEEEDSLKNRFRIVEAENKFIIERTVENDAGNYTCRAGPLSAEISVVAKPFVRLPPNTSVVEGEKLRIVCVVAGKPTPTVEWAIGNKTYTESDNERVTLSDENSVKNSVIQISGITLDDRGHIYCRAKNIESSSVNATEDSTFVRVKDNLAALWPFLGICAEVFVLCTIILVYEKRRNKPELDESDTDQSPDQKQTPDHGKDRDVRHRK